MNLSLGDGLMKPVEELHSERLLTDDALRLLSPTGVPDDLQLRLRVMLSHERVRAERKLMGRLRHQWTAAYEQWVRPIGAQIAVAAVALLMVAGAAATLGAVAPQQAVQANDTPLDGFSAPVYQYSAAGETPVYPVGDAPLIVQAMVNARGQVYTYRVLSGELDAAASDALQQRMLGGVFEPARIFGEPVRGSVVLTFSDVLVRG